jgi:hypothetical protein
MVQKQDRCIQHRISYENPSSCGSRSSSESPVRIRVCRSVCDRSPDATGAIDGVYVKKKTGAFVKWVTEDVLREESVELTPDLFSVVRKVVCQKSVAWYNDLSE